MLTCFSKKYLGIECPGCGIQRSTISLLRGDFLDSLALYPALIPFILLCAIGFLSFFKMFKINVKIVIALAIISVLIMVGHYILKITDNAPWYTHAAACF